MSTTASNKLKISVLVDYAHEPESMKRLLETAQEWKKRLFFDKIIHVVSCCGKGRDDWKKPVIGSISYTLADFSIVTTEEYTAKEDPRQILELLTQNFDTKTEIESVEKYTPNSKYLYEFNRKKALLEAKKITEIINKNQPENTCFLLISTSMGSQQTMTLPQGEVFYDERQEWRKIFE